MPSIGVQPPTAAVSQAPKRRQRKERGSALDEGLKLARERERQSIELILARVEYGSFLHLEPRLTLERFSQLRTLALLQSFFDMSDSEISTKMGVSLEFLAKLRGHQHYQPIRDAMVNEAVELGRPGTAVEFAQRFEGQLAKVTYLTALTADHPRERLFAAKDLLDRSSPKPTRQSQPGGVTVTIPENMQRTLEVAFRFVGDKLAPGGIDASVLNVVRETKLIAAPPIEVDLAKPLGLMEEPIACSSPSLPKTSASNS